MVNSNSMAGSTPTTAGTRRQPLPDGSPDGWRGRAKANLIRTFRAGRCVRAAARHGSHPALVHLARRPSAAAAVARLDVDRTPLEGSVRTPRGGDGHEDQSVGRVRSPGGIGTAGGGL